MAMSKDLKWTLVTVTKTGMVTVHRFATKLAAETAADFISSYSGDEIEIATEVNQDSEEYEQAIEATRHREARHGQS
jgi:hypothetical protein